MTEAEWLASAFPTPMLVHLKDRPDLRRLRLFACACCRRIRRLCDNRCRASLEIVEKYADGSASFDDLVQANEAAQAVSFEYEDIAATISTDDPNHDDAVNAARGDAATAVSLAACTREITAETLLGTSAELAVRAVVCEEAWGEDGESYHGFKFREPAAADGTRASEIIGRERKAQSSLLRDIFGNPFRPVGLNSSWVSPEVFEIAGVIYEQRAFERMRELADALEAAGCTEQAILSHCREPRPHVRGCWVVDLILGKH